MDAMNLIIGAVLFVVVMIVLLTNNQKVADLKKSIKTSAVEAPASVSHGFLARNSAGDYVPKRAYYVKLVPKPGNVEDLASDSQIHDRIFVDITPLTGGHNLIANMKMDMCKVIYRPETRVLYKVVSAKFVDENGVLVEIDLSADQIPYNIACVDLERNITTSSTTPMFAVDDIQKSDGTPRMRTIIGVPAEMSGNTVSGV